MNRATVLLLGLATSTSIIACAAIDDPRVNSGGERITTYRLIIVNDSSLPRTIERSTDVFGAINFVITASTIEIDSVGSQFSHTYSISQVRPNRPSIPSAGTPAAKPTTDRGIWILVDSTLTLHYEDGSMASGFVHAGPCGTIKFTSKMSDGSPVTYLYQASISRFSAAAIDPCLLH